MDLLWIPLIVTGAFLMPFAMAWLEPKPNSLAMTQQPDVTPSLTRLDPPRE